MKGGAIQTRFATSIKDILSTISGFSFSKVRELNLFCFIVNGSHVLSRFNVEKDRSGVSDVAPLVKTSLAIKNNISDQLALLTGPQLNTFDDISKVDWFAIIKNGRE